MAAETATFTAVANPTEKAMGTFTTMLLAAATATETATTDSNGDGDSDV